jgi:hypothetical protein
MLDAPDVLELFLSIGRRVLVGVILNKQEKDVGRQDRRIEEELTFIACFR